MREIKVKFRWRIPPFWAYVDRPNASPAGKYRIGLTRWTPWAARRVLEKLEANYQEHKAACEAGDGWEVVKARRLAALRKESDHG